MVSAGICLDHIFVKRSSIASAGNGAFARRHLKKNTVIIGSPMLAVSRDHKLLTMAGNSSSKSLIFNYHYGHKASSVLFFPNSHAIAINHNSKSMPSDGKPANARVQFSIKDKKSRYLVHRQLEDIVSEKYSSLVMEVVATRDIAPDEEIFIDYGMCSDLCLIFHPNGIFPLTHTSLVFTSKVRNGRLHGKSTSKVGRTHA